jgi:HemY protein
MRSALWLLALFAAAVGLALFTTQSQGTVTLFWPPYRIDLSLNLVVLGLLGLFVLLYLAVRAISALFDLPSQAKAWRALQRERGMHAELQAAITNLLAGRFARARKLALLSAQHAHNLGTAVPASGQSRALAHLVAAEAAQALQDTGERDIQLKAALDVPLPSSAVHVREGAQMRAARWALDDRDPSHALIHLEQLPQGAARRTIALRMRLRASRQAKRHAQALDVARLLAKHGAFSKVASQSIVRSLAVATLTDAHDADQLQRAWEALSSAERAEPEVATHAAKRLVNLSASDSATWTPQDLHERARAWLEPIWNQYPQLSDGNQVRIVQALEASFETIDHTWLQKIDTAHKQLPGDARLQYLAGMACMRRELWGKAQQLLHDAAPQLKDEPLRKSAHRALALLAEQRGDARGAAAEWRKAAH